MKAKKRTDAEILQGLLENASEQDLCTVEGIDSVTGLPFVADFRDLTSKKDTIREATERSNKR